MTQEHAFVLGTASKIDGGLAQHTARSCWVCRNSQGRWIASVGLLIFTRNSYMHSWDELQLQLSRASNGDFFLFLILVHS